MVRLGRGYPVNKAFRPGRLSPVYDATGAGVTGNASSLSFSHVIGPGANAILLGVCFITTSANTFSAAVGGVAMPPLATPVYFVNQGGNFSLRMIFGLMNPPTGTRTVGFTADASCYVCMNSLSYANVNSFGAAQNASGTGTGASQVVTAAPGNRIFQLFAGDSNGTSFSGYNQTQRWTQAAVGFVNPAGVIGDAVAAGASTSFSATLAGGSAWGSSAIPLL